MWKTFSINTKPPFKPLFGLTKKPTYINDSHSTSVTFVVFSFEVFRSSPDLGPPSLTDETRTVRGRPNRPWCDPWREFLLETVQSQPLSLPKVGGPQKRTGRCPKCITYKKWLEPECLQVWGGTTECRSRTVTNDSGRTVGFRKL